jgi:hypothetical protein
MRVGRVLVALAFLACIASPIAEGAITRSGGLKYVTKSFELLPGGARTTKAPCPGRNQVLGGGHYNSGGFGDVLGLHSYPYDGDDRNKRPDDGWAAMQRAFGEAVPAKVYAICGRVTPDYVKEKATIPPDGAEKTMEVECPLNILNVTSGGSRGPASVREVGGNPTGAEWWQDIANRGTSAREVTAFAICSTLDVDVRTGQVVAGDGLQSNATAQCPAEAPHVVGGSLSTNYTGTVQGNIGVAATQPYVFTNAFDGWRVWMDNYNAIDMNLTAVAICVPPL